MWRRTVSSLSTDTCFSMSNTCPVSLVSNCTQVVTVVCGKSFFLRKSAIKSILNIFAAMLHLEPTLIFNFFRGKLLLYKTNCYYCNLLKKFL